MNLDLIPLAQKRACARLVQGEVGTEQPMSVRRQLRAIEKAGLAKYSTENGWYLTRDGELALIAAHAEAAGAMCTEGENGCCVDCGVSLMGGACRECKCRGYHRKGCGLTDTFDPSDGGP